MNKYESIIIVKPNLESQILDEIIQKVTDLINEEGKITKVEKLGEKKLAYEIKKYSEGFYILFEFEAVREKITELERFYRITDEILKFIVVRLYN